MFQKFSFVGLSNVFFLFSWSAFAMDEGSYDQILFHINEEDNQNPTLQWPSQLTITLPNDDIITVAINEHTTVAELVQSVFQQTGKYPTNFSLLLEDDTPLYYPLLPQAAQNVALASLLVPSQPIKLLQWNYGDRTQTSQLMARLMSGRSVGIAPFSLTTSKRDMIRCIADALLSIGVFNAGTYYFKVIIDGNMYYDSSSVHTENEMNLPVCLDPTIEALLKGQSKNLHIVITSIYQ